MEPLDHSRATIVKLNGDFKSLEQRNTVDELSDYPPATAALLGTILENYGLLIAGWSGDWDVALVRAIESRQSRRYPLVWSTWGAAGAQAQRLMSGRGDFLIENTEADEFFADLLTRVEAIEDMADAPVSLDVKVARLRRALPDPVKHLELRALFETELEGLRTWAGGRPATVGELSADDARSEVTNIHTRFHSLLHLYAQGILLDRDQQHNELWVWVLQQALDARPEMSGPITIWWEALLHLPAFLLLRVGMLAALAAKHEGVLVRLCAEPHWGTLRAQQGKELPAHQVLRVGNVLNNEFWSGVLEETEGARFYWPGSHVMRGELRPIAIEMFGQGRAEVALGRMEYRLALASTALPAPEGTHFGSPEPGEYVLFERTRFEEDEPLALTKDFRMHGDVKAWEAAKPVGWDLQAILDRLDERLRRVRNGAD